MTMLPVINLNGTDGVALLKSYTDAREAIELAMVAVRNIGVHGRDYQTITNPASAGTIAVAENDERVRKLSTIHYELSLIIVSIERQLTARTKVVA